MNYLDKPRQIASITKDNRVAVLSSHMAHVESSGGKARSGFCKFFVRNCTMIQERVTLIMFPRKHGRAARGQNTPSLNDPS